MDSSLYLNDVHLELFVLNLLVVMDFNGQHNKEKTRVAVSLAFFLSGFAFATWVSRIPDIQQKYQMNDAELGSLLILLPLGLMITMPAAGLLMTRFSSRAILMSSSVVYFVLLFLLGMANELWQVGVILFLFGSSRSLFNIALNTQAVGVQKFYVSSIMSTFHGVWSIAGFAGAACAVLMKALKVGMFDHFSVVSLLATLSMFLLYRNTLQTDLNSVNKGPAFILPDGPLLRLGVIAFCGMICEATMSEWIGIYYQKAIKVPEYLTTVGYVAYLSTMTIGRFTGDWILDKTGIRLFLQGSGICVLAGIAVVILVPNFFLATIGCFAIGLGVSCVIPVLFSTATSTSKLQPGAAITSVSTIGYLGFLSGPSLVGFISYYTNIRLSFGLIGLAAIGIIYFSSRLGVAGNHRKPVS
jgi:MFS family permease